jgi:hypothetical protein
MAYEQRPGGGVLFKNTKKGDNEKAPDYTGNALSLTGEYFELSAWIKEGAKGKFMSIALRPKFEPQQSAPSKPAQQYKPSGGAMPGGFDEMSDDIPFIFNTLYGNADCISKAYLRSRKGR